MGGKRGKGGGKNGGKRGQKGGGKGGKRNGKGKGGGQVRRELAGLVGEVFRTSGEELDSANASRARGGGLKISRRVERRNQRKEAKRRRAHFFGEARRQQKISQVEKGRMRTEAEKAPSSNKLGGAGKSPGKKRGAKRQRVHYDDDDEEITSEEDGAVGSKQKKDDDIDEASDDEGTEEGEDIEEYDQGEGEDSEEEEESQEEEEEDDDADETKNEGPDENVKPPNGAYVPPHLRGAKRAAGSSTAEMATLQKQLRSIMNRVSEGNLDQSGRELCQALNELVPRSGATATAEALMAVLLPAAVGDPNISVLVLGCHVALAALAHVLFGSAFGGAVLTQTGSWLRRRLQVADESSHSTGEDARIAKNCVVFLTLLFSFGAIPGAVIFDLVRFIFAASCVSEVRVELALTLLRFAGRTLRAECVEDFKATLLFITDAAAGVRSESQMASTDSSIRTRVDFLLRELQDLKNNKVSFAVMDRFDAIRSWLQTAPVLARKKVADHQLAVPFKFLEEEPPAGWPLGDSASKWTLSARKGSAKTLSAMETLRETAVSQRLSTELRQNLFVALMGAEDFEHAAERLFSVAVGAKTGASEACLVLFHCAVREKAPNPFYEHVADTLCSRPAPWGKKFAHSFKRAAVQHMQQAHRYGLRAVVNLAELVAALVVLPSAALPLATMRFMKFGEAAVASGGNGLTGVLGLLLRHLMESLLHRFADTEAVSAAFGLLRKYDDVREGVLLVLDGMVKARLPSQKKSEASALWQKFRAARKELSATSAS